jgi:hypothetical protein
MRLTTKVPTLRGEPSSAAWVECDHSLLMAVVPEGSLPGHTVGVMYVYSLEEYYGLLTQATRC